MPEPEQQFKRQVAYKIRILDILNSNFSKDEVSAGYIILNGAGISRVNLIATLVYKSDEVSQTSGIIDDGTGKISMRVFDGQNIFFKIEVGDVVLVIGKIREFNNERYIYPEILRKASIEWLNLRRLELGKPIEKLQEKEESVIIEEVTEPATVFQQIYGLIKEFDKGEGATIEDVIKNSKTSEAEDIINKLLKNGDVFEIRPGRLKVQE